MWNVLVSGASGIVGYGILRSLKKSQKKLQLIGTTIYSDSVAQGFCDIFEQAPKTTDTGYMGWLLRVIKKHSIDFIIPGIEVDLYKWVERVSEIEESGAKVLLNNADLVHLCKDKWVFYKTLKKANTSHIIETSLVSDFEYLSNNFGLPFLLKPRCGFGSKGIVQIDHIDVFNKHKSKLGSILMAQPIVGNEDEEFTTSAFCDGKGGVFARMTLKRVLSKDGYTEKAEVVAMSDIDDALLSLCEIFKPIGPTNFQFRKHDGALKLLEINPRVSSATSIRTAFGYNECEMAIEYYLENREPKQPILKQGRAIRYIEDFIFYV
jgi:carbamoyl-phosphate synthase large subunit